MVDIGEKLKGLRIEKHMTQQQVAAHAKVTKSVISAYETSTRYPSYDILIKLASLFGVSTDYLLGVESTRYFDATGLTDKNIELISNLISALKGMNMLS